MIRLVLFALEIKEEKNTTARTIGTMAQGQLCYILADKDSDWVYIESGDVRGFVEQKYLDFSDETKSRLKRMVRINIRQQKKR